MTDQLVRANDYAVIGVIDRRFSADQALLNITVSGMSGDLPDPVSWDMTDTMIRQVAAEAVRSGYVPGIMARTADFDDFVVERFEARDGLPNRVVLRPKTAYGS